MSTGGHGLGSLTPDMATFIATLKLLSTWTWAQISAAFRQQFPGQGNPAPEDFRSRWCRQLRGVPLRRSLEGHLPIAANDAWLARGFLARYVPDSDLSPRGLIFRGPATGSTSAAPPAPIAQGSSTQASSQGPTPAPPAPPAPPVQPAPPPPAPTQPSGQPSGLDDSSSFSPRIFGWGVVVDEQGPPVQEEEQGQEPEPEAHEDEDEPEPYESIYPDPELYEFSRTR